MATRYDMLEMMLRGGALLACVAIIIDQSLTVQRSLSSMSTLDWIGMCLFGIALPIFGGMALVKWSNKQAIFKLRPLLLAILALLQAILIVFWPAYIMPGAFTIMINGSLVILSGGTLQFSIIGVSLLLATHSVIIYPPADRPTWEARFVTISTCIGAGVLFAGLGLGIASYFGWTMYLLPTILITIVLGCIELWYDIWTRHKAAQEAKPSVMEQASFEGGDSFQYSSKIGNIVLWSAMLFMSLPVLLLSMNFQRPRYAIGYFLPISLLGMIALCIACAWGFIIAIRKRMARGHIPDRAIFIVMLASLAVAGSLDLLPVVAMIVLPPEVTGPFFKSAMYMVITCGAFSAGFASFMPAITHYSTTLNIVDPQGKKIANILIGGVVLALLVVVFLFEGTSMIFSWNFGESETKIVTGVMEALGWFFFVVSLVVLIIQVVRTRGS